MNRLNHIVLPLMILLPLQLVAQTRAALPDSSYIKQLVIEKEFVPIVNDATKINRLPAIESITVQPREVKFRAVSEVKNTLHLQTEVLKSEETRMELPVPPRRGYATLGLGNYGNVFGGVGWNIIQHNDEVMMLEYGLKSTYGNRALLQTGVKKTILDVTNRLGWKYAKGFDKINLQVGLDYSNNVFGFYSVDSISEATPNYQKNQIHNVFGLTVKIGSTTDAVVSWHAAVGYSAFHKRHSFIAEGGSLFENRIKADGGVAFNIGKGFSLVLDTDIEGFVYNGNSAIKSIGGSDSFYNRLLWGFNPRLTWEKNNVDFVVGVVTESDFSTHNRFFIAPDLRFNWHLASGYSLFASLDGRAHRMGFAEMHDMSRMVSPSLRIADYTTPLDFLLGFKASALPNLCFNLSAGFSLVSNQPFLVNKVVDDYAYSEMLLTDRANVVYTQINAGVSYNINAHWSTSIDLKQLLWGKNIPVYNIPKTTLDVALRYVPNKKVFTELHYELVANRKTLNPIVNTVEQMRNANLLSLKGGYIFNERVSLNMELNNILHQQYDILWGLPGQRFNLMVGASYNF